MIKSSRLQAEGDEEWFIALAHPLKASGEKQLSV